MVHSHDFYNLYQKTYLKYTELYGQQVCVFLQKGSFYEIYGQQDPITQNYLNTGKQILEILGIVIHTYSADGPGGTTGYYGGVPVSVLTRWSEKLTSLGWTVVVIDEVKNGAGKVSKREVSRVLSAGTHIETAELGKAFLLASLWMDFSESCNPPTFGIASTDLTTGQVFLYGGSATGSRNTWHTDDIRHFFQVYPPKELLFHIKGQSSELYEDDMLRQMFCISHAPIHKRQVVSSTLDSAVVREEYLRDTFRPRTALPLRNWLHCHPDGSSLQERALVELLRFSEDHAPNLARSLQAPTLWHPTQNLQIINSALTQLNLIRTGTEQLCVEDLFTEPRTPMGKRSLLVRLCNPIADSSKLQERQDEITWILDKSSNEQKEIDISLGLIYDISRIHRSILRGTLHASDVLNLHQSYTSVKYLSSIVEKSPFSEKACLQEVELCLEHCMELFDMKKATVARETPDELGFLQDSISPKTAEAESFCQAVYKEANEWLQVLRRHTGVSEDACYYKPTEKNMFCIHTTKSAMTTMQRVLKQNPLADYSKLVFKSLTSAARIEHPSLEIFQEKLDSARGRFQRVFSQELPMVCIQYVEVTNAVWTHIEDWILRIDLANSFAKTALKQGWVRPLIEDCKETDASYVQIRNMRHPLIEAQKKQSKYVTHDICLGYGSSQGWLLYGMNASGKSSLMKAIGICVLLAQVGSYVPATYMVLRPYKKLATRILNQDNLWAGLSSFAVEMSELREIVSVADHQTLVGDELCAGTESISGTAIVAAGIQHLQKAGAQFVLATHLHDLMKLKKITELIGLKIYHLHVEYDRKNDRLVYHRTLKEGSGSTMYGLEVANALHLPNDMIESAFSFRKELLGETSIENASISTWSSSLVKRSCSVCGSAVTKELEVHHLEQRKDAVEKRNSDGQALNHIRNLAILCQVCHDKHHSGLLEVGPVEDTSEGPLRSIINLSKYAHIPSTVSSNEIISTKSVKKTLFTKEQIDSIKETQQTHPNLHAKLLIFQVQKTHGFSITEAQYKKLKLNGTI